MKDLHDFIESGILEMYVTGNVSPEESQEVERMALSFPEIGDQIREISLALEIYAHSHAIEPHPASKPFVLATIDYAGRMAAGEKPVFPPVLNEYSTYLQYAEYIEGKELAIGHDFTGIAASIIGYTPSLTTAIVWLKDVEISEIHSHEIEKFLILDGTCSITISGKAHHLAPGDFLTVPVDSYHTVKITSEVPCKAILQRQAC